MRTESRYSQIRYTGDIYVVTGLQAAAESMTGLQADIPGTLGIATFNTTTGKYTSTVTKADITTNNPKFKLAYKDADGNITSLAEMSKDEVIVRKLAYKAPIKQVSAIGYNGTTGSLNYTTVVSGDEAIIKITNTTETGAGLPYDVNMAYSYIAKSTDTPTSILTNLVAQINNDASFQHKSFGRALYAATLITVGGLGISITTADAGETFSVSVDGVLAEATRTLVTPYELGVGSGIQTALIERINDYSKGNGFANEERSQEYPSITKLAEKDAFYTLYVIENKPSATARRDRFKTNMWLYVKQANAATPATLLDILLP